MRKTDALGCWDVYVPGEFLDPTLNLALRLGVIRIVYHDDPVGSFLNSWPASIIFAVS